MYIDIYVKNLLYRRLIVILWCFVLILTLSFKSSVLFSHGHMTPTCALKPTLSADDITEMHSESSGNICLPPWCVRHNVRYICSVPPQTDAPPRWWRFVNRAVSWLKSRRSILLFGFIWGGLLSWVKSLPLLWECAAIPHFLLDLKMEVLVKQKHMASVPARSDTGDKCAPHQKHGSPDFTFQGICSIF